MISTDLMFHFHFKLDNLLSSYYLQVACVCSRKWCEVFKWVFCSHQMRETKCFALYQYVKASDAWCDVWFWFISVCKGLEKYNSRKRHEEEKEKLKRERGTLEVLRCPITGVVSEGFIPSVPCRVIVISLWGPTSTDEVRLTCQSQWAWSAGVTSSRESQTPRPQDWKDF